MKLPTQHRQGHGELQGSLVHFAVLVCVSLHAPLLAEPTSTLQVELKLETGGRLTGLVVDHTAHGLVLMADGTPYVFAWDEVAVESAVAAKFSILRWARKSVDHITPADRFELGVYALHRGRNDLAAPLFRKAAEEDPQLTEAVAKAFENFREQRKHRRAAEGPLELSASDGSRSLENEDDLGESTEATIFRADMLVAGPDAKIRDLVMQAYRSFGEKVRKVFGKRVELIETEHFLIWTDWDLRSRVRLGEWCEAMYALLCDRLGVPLDAQVFLAKCPIYAWSTKSRFEKFARLFDGHDPTGALGYTRSIEANGHVHVVLLRKGRSPLDMDRFASTLVHEGTHAFLHRLYSTRLIPHWVNEGYADLTAKRVLGERCFNGENASLLARQYARFDWPIVPLISSAGPIEVHQYPLAHSLVAYLESLGVSCFREFLKALKDGKTIAAALADNYDNMTPDDLERRWHAANRPTDGS